MTPSTVTSIMPLVIYTTRTHDATRCAISTHFDSELKALFRFQDVMGAPHPNYNTSLLAGSFGLVMGIFATTSCQNRNNGSTKLARYAAKVYQKDAIRYKRKTLQSHVAAVHCCSVELQKARGGAGAVESCPRRKTQVTRVKETFTLTYLLNDGLL